MCEKHLKLLDKIDDDEYVIFENVVVSLPFMYLHSFFLHLRKSFNLKIILK